MIEGLLFGFIIIISLGMFFPLFGSGIGFNLFMGTILVPLILFIGVSILGLPLFWVGILIIVIVTGRLFRFIIKCNYQPKDGWLYFFFHPGVVLPVLVLFTGVLTDYSSYLLWNWDEFSSWVSWAKQIYISDTSWRSDLIDMIPTYPKGWPMAIAFVQLPFGNFDEYRGIALLVLFHIALLALTFDLLRLMFEKDPSFSGEISFLFSWLTILIILSIESSWKLLPPTLLIERPVMYWSIGLFILALMNWYHEKSQPLLLFGMGITLASAFTLKTPTLGLVVPGAFIGLMLWYWNKNISLLLETRISTIKIITYLFIPLLLVVSLWYLHSDRGTESVGYPISFDENALTKFIVISGLLKSAFLDYLGSYKLPLTILGSLGLISALWYPRQRIVAIALILFVLLSWMGLWPLYMYNIQPTEYEVLPSLPRYARLPIRLIHYIGLIFLVLNFLTILNLPKKFLNQRLLIISSAVMILVLGVFQIWNLNKSYLDMGSRVHVSTTNDQLRHARIKKFRNDSVTLENLIDKFNLLTPSILYLSQGGDGFTQRMARYYSINDNRGGKIQKFRLQKGWSWGLERENVWMNKITEKGFKSLILSSEIIWPHKIDPWSREILVKFIKDKSCKQNITDYFLLAVHNTFKCYPKILD